jgi:hypothetical protein
MQGHDVGAELLVSLRIRGVGQQEDQVEAGQQCRRHLDVLLRKGVDPWRRVQACKQKCKRQVAPSSRRIILELQA